MEIGCPPVPAGPDSAIEPATLRAYRETDYTVFGSTPLTLHVGVRCAALPSLYARYQTHCSAFITACNPHGQLLDATSNSRLAQALLAEITRLGLAAIPGSGQHPSGSWPGEPSYLVPGLSRSAAQQLGRKFRQNAVIWTGRDAVPQLLLLR